MYNKNIASTRLLQKGIEQSFLKKDTFEIIISKVKKGTNLIMHSHNERQIGILLKGEFIFKTCDDTYYMKEIGCNYIVNSNILHSAEATEYFIALDFKYLRNIPLSDTALLKNSIKNSIEFFDNNHRISYFFNKSKQLKILLNKDYTYYFIANKPTIIELNQEKLFYKDMEILALKTTSEISNLTLEVGVLVILISTPKETLNYGS